LQGFLHWLESGAAEVKRDLDQKNRDEVRIMTVHGSKGLQAPIVFMPDTVSAPTQMPQMLWTEDEMMLWAPGQGATAPPVAVARQEALRRRDQEYRRLLYVALTRAEDRLYICGWETSRAPAEHSWYRLAERALASAGVAFNVATPPRLQAFAAEGWAIDGAQHPMVAPRHDGVGFALADDGADGLPDFITRPPPPEPAPPRPLIASRPSEQEPAPRSPIGDADDALRFQRGLLIHRLLQTLPDLEPHEIEAAGRRYLASPSHDLNAAQQAMILAETLAVLRHPEYGALFGPGSQAEISVAGLIDGRAFSGRLDRLVVQGDEVLIVDYKTNRPPPRERTQVAKAYLDQLAAYRAALTLIYPDKRIRTLLLWTDGPSLMEIEG
jgi:ATP-dependent helicase/nuclease subunit A